MIKKPTMLQLGTIRMIEENLPKVRFDGETLEDARQFISTHIKHSMQARREMWDAINEEEGRTPFFVEDGKGNSIFQDFINKQFYHD